MTGVVERNLSQSQILKSIHDKNTAVPKDFFDDLTFIYIFIYIIYYIIYVIYYINIYLCILIYYYLTKNYLCLFFSRCSMTHSCSHFQDPGVVRIISQDWHKQPGCHSKSLFNIPPEN